MFKMTGAEARRSNSRIFIAMTVLLAMGLIFGGCGGSSDGPEQPDPTQPTETGTVTGVVFMPDGQTPASNALVGVPANAVGTGSYVPLQTPDTVDEDDWLTHTFSGADGSFSLAGVPAGTAQIKIVKGQWSRTIAVEVTADETTPLPTEETTLPSTPDEGAPNIAVVTGSFDNMEYVLAKIGLGEVDDGGRLVAGTEQFDLYSGYAEMGDLLNDPDSLNDYNILFINCGASTGYASDQGVQENLQNFVAQGGVLYLTDLTFRYVEQVFPGRVEFIGGTGRAGIETDAEVVTDDEIGSYFKNWLASREALNEDGTVHIGGFAGGWGVIDTVDDSVRVWIRGEVTYSGSASEDELEATGHRSCQDRHESIPLDSKAWETSVRPLTVSFSHGEGRVLYTSYHTVHGAGQVDLFPQEIVLAGLVFEM